MTSHRTDLLALFAGLLFVAVGVLTLTGEISWLLDGQWLLPGALIALGIGILLTVTGSGRAPPAEDTVTDRASDAVHGVTGPDDDPESRGRAAHTENGDDRPDASR